MNKHEQFKKEYQKLKKSCEALLNELYRYEIHGSYAVETLFWAQDAANLQLDDFNNLLERHGASWADETLAEDADLIYGFDLSKIENKIHYQTMEASLAKCKGEVVILEQNIYRYRDLTDLEGASIITEFLTNLEKIHKSHYDNV